MQHTPSAIRVELLDEERFGSPANVEDHLLAIDLYSGVLTGGFLVADVVLVTCRFRHARTRAAIVATEVSGGSGEESRALRA